MMRPVYAQVLACLIAVTAPSAANPQRPATTHTPVFPQHQLVLDPGRLWVFQHDALASEVVGRVGSGHYWFTAWIAGRPYVLVAAGDVELRES
jgi:hypothetical protein